MDFRSLIRDLRFHLRGWWALYLSILGVLYLFYKIGDPLANFLGGWVANHTTVRVGSVSLDKSVTVTLAVACFVLSGLIILAAYTLFSLHGAKENAEAVRKGPILLKTFRKTIQAADLIVNKLFPIPNAPLRKVLSCKATYSTYENGDCQFTEDLVVAAAERDLHFIEMMIDAEADADPADFPDDIDLKISSATANKEIAYLITKNEPRSKRVVIFFLPFIKRGGEDVRAVTIKYHWKGLMKRLLAVGDEPFTYPVTSVEAIPTLEFVFWIKPKMGVLKCFNVGEGWGEGTGEEKLVEIPEDARGMSGWAYTAKDVPPRHATRLRLELKKKT